MATKIGADSHKRSRASVREWNQFIAANRPRILGIADFDAHPHSDVPYERSVHPQGHPAHSSNIRRLVTYASKNNITKDCKYGKYRDGKVVKCLRNPLHAPEGASHKRGAHTGNAIGRPPKRARNRPPRVGAARVGAVPATFAAGTRRSTRVTRATRRK